MRKETSTPTSCTPLLSRSWTILSKASTLWVLVSVGSQPTATPAVSHSARCVTSTRMSMLVIVWRVRRCCGSRRSVRSLRSDGPPPIPTPCPVTVAVTIPFGMSTAFPVDGVVVPPIPRPAMWPSSSSLCDALSKASFQYVSWT